jgi:tellurite resistance protein TehA-like permease
VFILRIMETKESEYLPIIIAVIIGFFVLVFITRWIFQIGKQIKYQEAMINLLMKIASGETMTKEELSELRNKLSNQ